MEVIVAFIDAPDPDNFALLKALNHLFRDAVLHVVLTGRPFRLEANKHHEIWEWDIEASRMAQQVNAARTLKFLADSDIHDVRIFDGGIAPRAPIAHHKHFAEYYRFVDADWLCALRYPKLESQEELVRSIVGLKSFKVAVGGPMTGLSQMMIRCPDTIEKIQEVHAMFATWGKIELASFEEGKSRGGKQFNVDCDPLAAYHTLCGLTCPIFLMPTEVTRVPGIGFENPRALSKVLPKSPSAQTYQAINNLWYEHVVAPRQVSQPNERIYIHDIVAALSMKTSLRERLYDIVPVEVTSVPHLPREQAEWGVVKMRETSQPTNIFAAKGLKPGGEALYLKTLAEVFAA